MGLVYLPGGLQGWEKEGGRGLEYLQERGGGTAERSGVDGGQLDVSVLVTGLFELSGVPGVAG